MKFANLLIMTTAAAMIWSSAALAAEYEIKTLNMGKHGMFQLEPSFLKVAPGDQIHFIAKDKGHNVQSIAGMIPDGAVPFKGELNKDLTVTFAKPGVYGIECAPHYAMGMVALVVVGDPAANLAKAEAVPQPGKAKKAFVALFEKLAKGK